MATIVYFDNPIEPSRPSIFSESARMIRMDDEVKAVLDKIRIHPRETYAELIDLLIDDIQTAGGRAGVDVERLLEQLSEKNRGALQPA
jgi:hypothetical protein